MEYLYEFGDSRLRLVLHPAVAAGNLYGRTFEESRSWSNWGFEGNTVCATNSVGDEYRIDVRIRVKRRDMSPDPCGGRLVSISNRHIFDNHVGTAVAILAAVYRRCRERTFEFPDGVRHGLFHDVF